VLAAVGGTALLLGWLGPAPWATAPGAAPVVLAEPIDLIGSPDATGRLDGVLQLRLRNGGTGPVTVVGPIPGYAAVQIASIPGAPLVAAGRAEVTVLLNVVVECRSSLPLVLPLLRLRDGTGTESALVVRDVVAPLVAACSTADHPATLDVPYAAATVEGSRFRLPLRSADGRDVQVLAISAGDADLTGRPLPVLLNTDEVTIWLDRPACPHTWDMIGLPTRLQLTVAPYVDPAFTPEGTAVVTLPFGRALLGLSSWAATACRSGGTT
jgi:hypothetical protein